MQSKTEDAGGLTPTKDDNASIDSRTADLFAVFSRIAIVMRESN